MFGINNFEQVGQIVQGHYNEIVKNENDLFNARIAICNKCPLCAKTSTGPVCSSKLCFNTKTESLETAPGKDIVCGCGCRLNAKARVKTARCVLNKWPK